MNETRHVEEAGTGSFVPFTTTGGCSNECGDLTQVWFAAGRKSGSCAIYKKETITIMFSDTVDEGRAVKKKIYMEPACNSANMTVDIAGSRLC